MLRADLIERMVAAGVVADVQPQFVLTDSAWVDRRLPAPLLPFAYAWRTLLARGIVCAGGSGTCGCSERRAIMATIQKMAQYLLNRRAFSSK